MQLPPHIEVYLPEEFIPLIGKRAQCYGNFRRSFDSFGDEIVLDVDTALDCEQLTQQLKTVFYEPEEVELSGLLHEMAYPGPPEYMSIEMGDHPEEVVILTLEDPINVDVKGGDNFNGLEQGVRELQVVFSDSMPSTNQIKEEIVSKDRLRQASCETRHLRQ